MLSPFLFALYLDDLSRLGSSFKGCFVILYADDILLLSPSVSQLEKLLRVCERELDAWLDMAINFKKSRILIGPRCDKTIGTLYSETGHSIPSVSEIAILSVRPSVRDVPVLNENGLIYRHRFFIIR